VASRHWNRLLKGHPTGLLGALALVLLVVLLPTPGGAEAKGKACPDGMVKIGDKVCIDQFEASTVELLPKGKSRSHSPYEPVKGLRVKAVSKKGKVPQAHISQVEAAEACANAGKRLCSDDEWLSACKGKKPTTYPYGDEHKDGYCNDRGVSSFNHYYAPPGEEPPQALYSWDNMNDPRLNQLPGTLAPAGKFAKCRNSYKVQDMVGNLHEWTSAKRGTFRGGYYLDTTLNGEGCEYRTTAHDPSYHDYSTGFRCCK
jgi:sulfatase modifying factor 1